MNKPAVVVIFGGTGPEHDVSLMSAASVLNHMDKEKYEIRKVGITKEGKWIETPASASAIQDGSWLRRVNNREVYISPDRTFKGMRTVRGKDLRVDCVFPVLHGIGGEDGTVQGLLELSGIPYVGSGVLASAVCLDKAVAKALVDKTDILHAKYCVTDRYRFSCQPGEELKRIEETFDGKYPLFVKPATAGSSVGVSKVNHQMELFEGIKNAALEDHKILIEEAIVGRELEVAIIGNRSPHPSPIGEIIPGEDFYTYEDKYINNKSRTEIVVDLTPEKEQEIQDCAVEIYRETGCRGLARVDFFLTREGKVYFNEINTMPGFTKISMYPKLWEAAGIEYSELIDRLISLAMEED